jgi:hypothetical protein
LPGTASALTIWSGRDHAFAKPDSADWTLPENQDRITASVWLTRANSRGLFNIAQEDTYTTPVSPLDTEWATGDAVDWESLTFAPWRVWNGGLPPSMVGVDAVVHLISDDIYLDIRFESWTEANGGGGFSYLRASPPVGVGDDLPRPPAALTAAPNPFNPATTLRFALAAEHPVRLALYDARGRCIRTLIDGPRPAGNHAVRWDGRDDGGRTVAAGTYLARLQAGDLTGATAVTLLP